MSAVFVIQGSAHLFAVLLLGRELSRSGSGRRHAIFTIPALCYGAAAIVAVAAGFEVTLVALVATSGALVASVAAWRADDFRPAGTVPGVSLLIATVAGTIVSVEHLVGFDLSLPSQALLWAATIVSVIRTPSGLLHTFESWEAGMRMRWHQPRDPLLDWTPDGDAPMVSIQVPTHAEPPEIVIATLDALAQLDYPNFEVLVIDNNTTDETLWRPVEAHCARLGARFRFFHVEGIEGAKAGALNWSRPFVDDRATLVALVDADYQVDRSWLAHTVGYFDDPAIGFVQCPHAYRDYEHSRYGRMANTAYAWAQATEMVSRHEDGAGITIGTMSVIRVCALDAAGGWAEWCMTEDSELAIRAHAAGYRSVFVQRVYGRGLIPETFAELKKQRFRWTYGPGQELKTHLRLYLPRPLGKPSLLTGRQRARHGHYGLVVLMIGLGALALPISFGVLVSMFAHREVPLIDVALLIPFVAILAARRVMRWTLYRTLVGTTFREWVGGSIVLLSVRPTVSLAATSVLVGRPTLWERTNKFRSTPAGYRALASAGTEMVLCAVCIAAAVAAPIFLQGGVFPVLLAAGFAWQAIVYACAPVVAILADRDLRDSSPSRRALQRDRAATPCTASNAPR
ncbi:MAG TPA: glycosyltransferase [Conexibacter sp.]|nr:glycosyltransferase [Conexibacter sp.]